MTNIIHISNGFTTNILYEELFKHLYNKQIYQYVIAPTFSIIDTNRFPYPVFQYLRNTAIWERLLFKRKINKVWAFMENQLNLPKKADLIHAHTLFSDGALAYKANTKYGIPYIVAIRNTDINVFFKYFRHLHNLGVNILKNAQKIILLSPVYKDRLKIHLSSDIREDIFSKIEVIPNGIGDIWINNRLSYSKSLNSPIRLIFCGSFDKNKNITSIIEALKKVNKYYRIELKLIGRNPNKNNSYTDFIINQSKEAEFKIEIINKLPHIELLEQYRSSDIFIMPSHTETFGLVYAEALSQGLPLIYTKNEGFDGYFKDGIVGYAVKSHSIDDIANKIINLIKNYSILSTNISKIDLNLFSWTTVAERYTNIYNSIIKHK